MFQQTANDKFSDISDLIESFYSFNAKIVKKAPVVYMDNEIDFNKLIFYAMKGMILPETGSVKKTVMFLSAFIKESRNQINMTNAILLKGEEIIKTTLLCIGGFTSRTVSTLL